MIRLRVSAEEDTGRDLAGRLRGATMATCADISRFHEATSPWDAAAFIGGRRLDAGTIDRCLNAGKHVLLAAHTCLPPAALERLAATARQKSVQLAVANPDRYLPSHQLIRQQIDAGNLGEPGLVRIHSWEPAGKNPDPDDLPGTLLRALDLAMWLIGKRPNLLYALGSLGDKPYAQVHLGFPGGAMALVDHAERLPAGAGYHAVSVIGSAGAAYLDDHQNMQLLFRGACPQAVRTGEGVKQLAALLQDFVDALQAKRDLFATVAAWRDLLTVGTALRRSLESRQAVPLEGL